MAGPLSPDERRALRGLAWSESVRKYQYIVLGGVGLMIAAWAYFLYALFTVPLHSGITFGILLALILLFVGAAGLTTGRVLRIRAMRRIAFRPCPSCQQLNLWLSEHCRKCGAALLGVEAPMPSRP